MVRYNRGLDTCIITCFENDFIKTEAFGTSLVALFLTFKQKVFSKMFNICSLHF